MGYMTSWVPLFSSIVSSSLWSEPDHVKVIFITMLALKNADHIVPLNAYNLGHLCWPADPEKERKAMEALEILSSPDKRRLEPQPFEGRRIKKVPGGWLILNGQVYENMMREVGRKAYRAEWMRNKRKRGGSTARERLAVEAYGNGETELAEEIASRGLPTPRNGEGVSGQ